MQAKVKPKKYFSLETNFLKYLNEYDYYNYVLFVVLEMFGAF